MFNIFYGYFREMEFWYILPTNSLILKILGWFLYFKRAISTWSEDFKPFLLFVFSLRLPRFFTALQKFMEHFH